MIKEIEIENFRCFEHTKISGFERVNLIGGKNNSGKTALLEALLIYACPTARSILEIEQIRKKSLDFVKSLPDRAWDDLFFNQNKVSAIRIVGKKGEENSKIIEIMISNLEDLSNKKDAETLRELYSKNASISVLAIEIVENKEEKMQYPLIATSDSIIGSKSSDTANANISPMIPASFSISSKKLTEEYDKARLDDKEGEVLKGFQILDDSIEAVESFSIGEPALYLKRKNQKRLPLSLFGDAINKMAVIILTLINNNDKILLIDEIENGIHYSNQREFWDNLFRLSIEYDIQIFATTHSLEMIQAFVDTGLNYKEAGAYFELAISSKTDQIIGIKRDLETLEYALKHGKGVRGE